MAKKSAGTPATVALARAGAPHTLHPYEHDPASTNFGDEAAAALGVDPARIFKTLLCDLHGGSHSTVCVVVPVATQADLKAVAAHFHAKKAELADPAAAERSSGYVVGGISPLGQKRALPTVVDASAKAFATIYVSAGRRGLQVELSPADLVALTRGSLGAIGR